MQAFMVNSFILCMFATYCVSQQDLTSNTEADFDNSSLFSCFYNCYRLNVCVSPSTSLHSTHVEILAPNVTVLWGRAWDRWLVMKTEPFWMGFVPFPKRPQRALLPLPQQHHTVRRLYEAGSRHPPHTVWLAP